ncbi:hypothetical protein BGZ76_007372, partial [Entomortierella beljakovae]
MIETDPSGRKKYKSPKPLVDTQHVKVVSQLAAVINPKTHLLSESLVVSNDCQDLELEILSDAILPSETTLWIQIKHAIKFSVVFSNPLIKPFVVRAPVSVGWISNIDQILDAQTNGPFIYGNSMLPAYGDDMNQSTLLDSNDTDLSQAYHPDLPPVYELL